MPIPLIPLVAGTGLVALLFAGSKEGSKGAPATGPSATPTQASTGGADGGAQYPSHSDVGAGETNLNVGGRGDVSTGYLTAPTAPTSYGETAVGGGGSSEAISGGAIGGTVGFSSGSLVETGQEGAFSNPDSWAPSSGGSITDAAKLEQFLGTGITSKQLGAGFASLGESLGSFGKIW
jgi:hypothetical protein